MIRRKCLDHLIIFNEALLLPAPEVFSGVLSRTQDAPSLANVAPEPRAVQPLESGAVVAITQVGGLHHPYERRAACNFYTGTRVPILDTRRPKTPVFPLIGSHFFLFDCFRRSAART
jgi:hypothetical protein